MQQIGLEPASCCALESERLTAAASVAWDPARLLRDACVCGGFAAPPGAATAAAAEVSAEMGTLPFTGFTPAAALAAALSASAGGGICLPAAGLPAVAVLLLLAGREAVEEDEVREASAASLLLLVDRWEASMLEAPAGSASFLTEVVRRTADLGAVPGAAGLAPGAAGSLAAAGLAGEAGLAAALMVSALVGELTAALGLSVTVAAGLTAGSFAALAAGSLAALLGDTFPALPGLAVAEGLAPAELVRAGLSASCFAAACAWTTTGR